MQQNTNQQGTICPLMSGCVTSIEAVLGCSKIAVFFYLGTSTQRAHCSCCMLVLLGHVGGNTPVWPISHISVWNCVLSGVYVIFSEALNFLKLWSPYSLKRFLRKKLPNVSCLKANTSLSSGLLWTSKCFVSKITPSLLHLDLHR